MREPKWLRHDVVEQAHAEQIAEHGGADGIRDAGLLESALNRPKNRFAYGDQPTLNELAASYCIGIAKNHPFVDGNKRVAWMSMRAFLRLNGVILEVPAVEKYVTMIAVASGEMSEQELVTWLDAHCSLR